MNDTAVGPDAPAATADHFVRRDITAALDHLLIGAPSLNDGVDWLEERTGVRAAMGGSHPGLGTWNALASIGPRQYIEIIAPDPAQDGIDTFYVPGLREFKEPRLATWAAHGTDVASEFPGSLPADFACAPPRPGSRIRPDGIRLSWTLAFPKHARHGTFGGAIPFFIEWASPEAHPGGSTPAGLRLRALCLSHPRPDELRLALGAFDLDAVIRASDSPYIHAELQTPRGIVRL